ncbi:MAG: nucleotide sugar dehydrogenase [Gammaproteobacteria bacterium]|nr:nucleotide sugar dehydrogenase [Gammaproteobacteria bacterium]
MSYNLLLDRLNNKEATIGVVGLGYVGLPLVLRFIEVGFKVIGFDIDKEKIDNILQGKSYIKHIDSNKLKVAVDNGSLMVKTDYAEASNADAILLCVPTPLNKYREPDLSFVIDTIEALLPYLKKQQLISLESTTYPGTTEEELKPRIETKGFKVGEDIFLVYSPEREDPANKAFCTQTIPKICGGTTDRCLQAGLSMYGQIVDTVVPVSSTKVAELTKLLENIHRAVNIGLVNEMKIVADNMGINIHEVISAAATKPFGFVPYYPGPGLGGHCIPIDPFYLTWKAREYGLHTRFIELAGEINSMMPKWVIDKLTQALNEKAKSVRGSNILIMGLAYKKNIDDIRESPSVEIIDLLIKKGAIISYHDPYIAKFPHMRNHFFDLNSIQISSDCIKDFDAVIIVTAHDDIDYEMLQQNAKLIVDTRNIYPTNTKNVVQA